MIERIDISSGAIQITLSSTALVDNLDVELGEINSATLSLELPFQTRKRGVETKLIIGHVAPEKDKTLIRNVATAHKWLVLIKTGKTLDAIGEEFKTSRRRIQQMLQLTFLAPDIVQMIVEGRQPIRMTSEWVLRASLPNDWQAQRELIATL